MAFLNHAGIFSFFSYVRLYALLWMSSVLETNLLSNIDSNTTYHN